MSNKRKHNSCTLKDKIEVLNRLDNGESVYKLALEFGVGKATISDWKKNRPQIERFCATVTVESLDTRHTSKASSFDKVDEALFLWFMQEKAKGTSITGPLIQEKALQLNTLLEGDSNFKASSGWLYRWKTRHGVRHLTNYNYRANQSVVKQFIKNESIDMDLGDLVIEGKTKKVYKVKQSPDKVILISKDRITAGDGVKAHDLKGKAKISNATNGKVFEYLNAIGIKTHFISKRDENSFIAVNCDMIPIEWVTRRIATGSFLKRNVGVPEGYRFCPPKLETFYKDDANHDPQWSTEQIISANFKVGGITIGREEVDIMLKTTATVFEVLEKAWASVNCSLIDMKLEFGVSPSTGEILLSDVIDSDSWRLWPTGDKRLMVDKQVYRNLKEVTQKDLDTVKRNFEWVAEQLDKLTPKPTSQVAILMGSSSDREHCEKIAIACKNLGVPSEMRITSAHKGSDETLNIIAQYEGEGIPTVFIAVAGRSNGLGPVTSGNSTFPVINCPPLSGDWGSQDVWSSLRLPSGLGCSTVLNTDGAALCAAQILGLHDHVIWSKLRAQKLNTWVSLKLADKKIQKEQGDRFV